MRAHRDWSLELGLSGGRGGPSLYLIGQEINKGSWGYVSEKEKCMCQS